MSEFKRRPHLKRNLVIAVVLLFVCGAAYLNWSYNARWGDSNAAMARAEDGMADEASAAYEAAEAEEAQLVSD